eukprot:CAMPEP_0117520790 /NCGR_PEP_ID=MMETSP0784-20121206/33347_1 /TAXON_ID=39447 /ORGANISM="" /LENGTH=501 /DNA_ID=CAMNT_0005316789 /DNA_START=53 /DNA_END=1559 /DNA_ORIENTATION=-
MAPALLGSGRSAAVSVAAGTKRLRLGGSAANAATVGIHRSRSADDVVVGAGILGVCTAYRLARQGRKVTVLEARGGPAEGSSFINGTLVCPSLMLPWTGPQMIPKLLRSLVDPKHPLKLHGSAVIDPALWRFAVHYFMSCRPGRTESGTFHLARLAAYSRDCLAQLLAEDQTLAGIMDQTAQGTLQVFDNHEAMERCMKSSERIRAAGVPLQALLPEECNSVDPSVVRAIRAQDKEAAYIYSALDTNGDCYKLTRRLVEKCEKLGVTFEYKNELVGFRRDPSRELSLTMADGREVCARNVVLCAGTESPRLASMLGLYLPMCPVKGYAITVPLRPGARQLRSNVVQDANKLYLAPLGPDHVRITGCAEFAGGGPPTVDESRAGVLAAHAEALLPDMLDFSRATYHAGLRPLSADDMPILGRAGPGVYLNKAMAPRVGHTLSAAGSSSRTRSAAGRPPSTSNLTTSNVFGRCAAKLNVGSSLLVASMAPHVWPFELAGLAMV